MTEEQDAGLANSTSSVYQDEPKGELWAVRIIERVQPLPTEAERAKMWADLLARPQVEIDREP